MYFFFPDIECIITDNTQSTLLHVDFPFSRKSSRGKSIQSLLNRRAVRALTTTMDDASLAEQLRPLLKPARGFAPKLSHICAAILMARDAALSSREACRRVPGVPLGAHNRVTELASRIRGLLSAEQLSPPAAAAAANAAVPAAPSSTAPSPLLNNPLQQPMAPDESMSWDLPPLEATRETPSNVPQQQQIEEPEPMDVEMEPVEMEPASTPHTLTAPASTPPAATPLGRTW